MGTLLQNDVNRNLLRYVQVSRRCSETVRSSQDENQLQ